MDRAIILANGAPKWPCGELQHKLVDRLARQLSSRGVEFWVATRDASLTPAEHQFKPPVTRRICETLLSTKELWKGQMGVFQSDTWYSERTMDQMVAAKGLHVFGQSEGNALTACQCAEVWGVTWGFPLKEEGHISHAWAGHGNDEFSGYLQAAIDDSLKRDPEHKEHLMAGMWEIYRLAAGFDPWVHQFETTGIWVECSDWTGDFDTKEEHDLWTRRRENRFVQMKLPPIPEMTDGQ